MQSSTVEEKRINVEGSLYFFLYKAVYSSFGIRREASGVGIYFSTEAPVVTAAWAAEIAACKSCYMLKQVVSTLKKIVNSSSPRFAQLLKDQEIHTHIYMIHNNTFATAHNNLFY